jgi:hypothetical protein
MVLRRICGMVCGAGDDLSGKNLQFKQGGLWAALEDSNGD